MQGLSYGVVRVDSENSLTSLTLQDCGQVMPGGKNNLFVLVILHCFRGNCFCVIVVVLSGGIITPLIANH